ncbi:MAG: hypothetical protein WCS27_17395 [Victivallaceae bacterium]
MQIFTDIKVKFDLEELASALCLNPDMPEYSELAELVKALEPHAKPAALLAEAAVIGKTPERILSSKGEFNSPLLAQLAADAEKLFPFIVTCGGAMENFAAGTDDPLRLYWIDFLKEYALGQAFEQIKAGLAENFPGRKVISLVPIDNSIWKIEGLREIFTVFPREAIEKIGVELTEYFYMKPAKTRAGVFFPAFKELDICSLCKVKKCNACPVNRNKN